MDDEQRRKHQEAWERYMAAERRDLEHRRDGLLARLLGVPLPGESRDELERLAREDERTAEEGLVALRSPGGEVWYKHIDDLAPEDRADRAMAERARVMWLRERQSERF
ncbi:MAG: hypothetical protein LC781_14245 [Actinobacteria bacterium]|nr:hypothetical protein [Actinomycetota bacterium]